TPHGGIRVILEWANRLSKYHQVFLFTNATGDCSSWFDLDPAVEIIRSEQHLLSMDCLVICSPHHIRLRSLPTPVRKFVFMQMAEHMFRPDDAQWQKQCRKFYNAPFP